MSKFTKQDFRNIAENKGLISFKGSNYLLLDCNIIFEYNEYTNYVVARGFIPMELAMEMYEEFKEVDAPAFSNCVNHFLMNPMKIAEHKDLDVNQLLFFAKKMGQDFETVYEEARKQMLEEDYENCYLQLSYIYTPEAFNWFIDKTQNYYHRKKEKNPELKKTINE